MTLDLEVKSNKVAMNEYFEAYELWQQKGPQKYTLQADYRTFSPVSGLWEVIVEDGKVMEWSYDGKTNLPEHQAFASTLVMEEFFKMAETSFHNKEDAFYFVTARYDGELGYVSEIKKSPNLKMSRKAPQDLSYTYKIILTPLK